MDRRIKRHASYRFGRPLVRQTFAWPERVVRLERVKLRSLARVGWLLKFAAAADNLWRLPKLGRRPPKTLPGSPNWRLLRRKGRYNPRRPAPKPRTATSSPPCKLSGVTHRSNLNAVRAGLTSTTILCPAMLRALPRIRPLNMPSLRLWLLASGVFRTEELKLTRA